jgi:hypothetical protein
MYYGCNHQHLSIQPELQSRDEALHIPRGRLLTAMRPPLASHPHRWAQPQCRERLSVARRAGLIATPFTPQTTPVNFFNWEAFLRTIEMSKRQVLRAAKVHDHTGWSVQRREVQVTHHVL